MASAQALGSRRSAAEVRETVWDVINPLGAVDRASDAVGRGNLKVFAEIGREFARFLAVCLDDPDCDAATIAQFCAGLRPGDPPEGQQYLRQAFGHYHGAILEADAALRAQLLLLANLEIGYHEQTRLQPEIAEAMNAALIDRQEFRRRLIKALFPRNTWLTRLRLFLPRLFGRPDPIDAALDDLLAEARRLAHLVVTERMMTLGLPHGVVLRLGDDVPGTFPPSLVQITLPDLQALIARFDPTPDSTRGSGAADWSALSDRLRYIVDLFRCYHEAADLLDPPFMAGQVTALEAGLLPEGRL